MAFEDPAFVEIYEQIDGTRTIDLEFYGAIAKDAAGPVLDAGCGSGRILLPLLRQGIDISGFDPSDAMLALLRERAGDLKPNVWQGDFDSIEGSYSAIISPYNTLLHLLTQEEQMAAFGTVHKALAADGVFAFDIVNPYTLDIYDDRRRFESTMTDVKTGRTVEIWRQFEFDQIGQRAKYNREFISGAETFTSSIEFRWSYPSEIRLLLKSAGFSSCEVYGDFEKGPLKDDSQWQIWVTRK